MTIQLKWQLVLDMEESNPFKKKKKKNHKNPIFKNKVHIVLTSLFFFFLIQDRIYTLT